jgi:hypothetical protein
MFAANRTDNVIGRIILLIISITTINGIKGAGVPDGTRWAKNSFKLFIRLKVMNANQNGSARDRVMARCLVAVKVNDASPAALLYRISKNNEENKMIFDFFLFKSVLNSLFIVEIIFVITILCGDSRVQ